MFKPITVIAMATALASAALATELLDPTAPFTARPSYSAQNDDDGFVLSAIIISERRRVAIINNQAYQVGHRFRGYQITAIEAHSVQLIGDGTSRTLQLGTERLESSDDAN